MQTNREYKASSTCSNKCSQIWLLWKVFFGDTFYTCTSLYLGKIDPIGALVKLLKKALKELADPAKLQQAVADMKADPSKLDDLAVKIKGELLGKNWIFPFPHIFSQPLN